MKWCHVSLLLYCALLFHSNAADALAPTKTSQLAGTKVTFNKDVAPILFKHCSICHRPGQAGPFNLLTYSDVKKRAQQIVEVVEKRYMPPWMPERGLVQFLNDRSLTGEQIEVIRRWVSEGTVEGQPQDLPALPEWTEGWQLGKPDLVVKAAQPYTLAAEGKDVYRNFVIPVPISARKYVQGVEFLPGNWKVVHHAFITVDSTRLSRVRAAKENPPGFDGMLLPETAVMPDGHFLGWQPGKVPSMAPPGLAWTLETNSDVVLQLHLHPTGKPEMVQPVLGFYFTTQPPTNRAFRINLNALRIDIPAGAKDYAVEDTYKLPIDIRVIGVSPHAHYLGKSVEGWALLGDGTKQNLIKIQNWDFNWQGDYRYANPIALPKGTTLTMKWVYDNSTGNIRNPNHPPLRVRHGSQTTNEMGELWFQVLPRNESDLRILARDFYEHLGRLAIDYNEFRVSQDPNDAEAHTKAGRAKFYFGEVQNALAHFQAAIKADPGYDRAYYELGFIYLRQNRLAEARQAFENVIKLNPNDYEAEGSLGLIFLRQKDLEQAEAHFRSALRINPDDKIASRNLERILQSKASSTQSK
jgi:hypothetical protein